MLRLAHFVVMINVFDAMCCIVCAMVSTAKALNWIIDIEPRKLGIAQLVGR